MLIRIIISLVVLTLGVSCRSHPLAIPTKYGMAYWGGGSLGTKSDFEKGELVAKDGTRFYYEIHKNDETVIPSKYIEGETIVGLASEANTGEKIRETNETRRHVSDNSLKATTEKQKTIRQTFVPEPIGLP